MIYFHVFSPIFGLALNTICQICYCRYIKNANLLYSTFFGFIIGMFGLVSFEIYYLNQLTLPFLEKISFLIVNFISYSASGYCYFHFINLGETARRIRLLRELSASNNGLSVDEILQRYNAKEIIDNRLARLLKNRQIIEKNNRYYIGNPTMFFMSKIILFLKLFILGKKSEFD